MRSRSSLSELITRVEAARWPNRELDANLWALENGYAVRHDPKTNIIWAERGSERVPLGNIDPGKYSRNFTARTVSEYPVYTASLDAALALTERLFPTLFPMVWKSPTGAGWAAHFQDHDTDTEYAPTPALALILATLRALEARDGSSRSQPCANGSLPVLTDTQHSDGKD